VDLVELQSTEPFPLQALCHWSTKLFHQIASEAGKQISIDGQRPSSGDGVWLKSVMAQLIHAEGPAMMQSVGFGDCRVDVSDLKLVDGMKRATSIVTCEIHRVFDGAISGGRGLDVAEMTAF